MTGWDGSRRAPVLAEAGRRVPAQRITASLSPAALARNRLAAWPSPRGNRMPRPEAGDVSRLEDPVYDPSQGLPTPHSALPDRGGLRWPNLRSGHLTGFSRKCAGFSPGHRPFGHLSSGQVTRPPRTDPSGAAGEMAPGIADLARKSPQPVLKIRVASREASDNGYTTVIR